MGKAIVAVDTKLFLMESLAGSSVHDFLSHDSTHGSFPVLMLLLPLLKLIEDNMALNREITLVMA